MASKPSSESMVQLTNPEKVLYPATGTTKADVYRYYTEIAPFMLPHLLRRPVTRRVWPNGVEGTTFFSKDAVRGVPDWINRVPMEHESGTKDYVLLDSEAALAWDAQQAGLEIHVPQWRFAALANAGKSASQVQLPPTQLPPDRLVIDLDPGEGATLADCAKVALRAREVLHDIGLEAYPVTSGSKGIHIYANLAGFTDNSKPLTADHANAVAKEIAKILEAEQPDKVISTMSKASRIGKVLVDWSQNNGKKTTISPYSLRGISMPYVAAPRTWDEIAKPGLKQLTYQEVLQRAKKQGDLLAGLLGEDNKASKTGETIRAASVAATRFEPMLASMPNQHEKQMLEHQGQQEDPEWGFEIKWDGYRAIAVIENNDGKPELTLWSRNGQNYTETYPELKAIVNQVRGPFPIVLDGEIVAFDNNKRPSFAKLQQHAQKKAPAISFQCFDILQQGDSDLTKLPFTERREKLEQALDPEPPIYISHLIPYEDAMKLSQQFQLEGVMAKRLSAPYQSGYRSKDWLKIKHLQTEDFTVVGYIPLHAGEPNESKDAIGSILLAKPRPDGKELNCVGRVGTGFTQKQRQEIWQQLYNIGQKEKPANLNGVTNQEGKHVLWVHPTKQATIEYAEWTTEPDNPEARLRHPRWRGWK